MTSIGSSAFYNCSILEEVSIPNSVTSIGEQAFCGCSNLATAVIGNSVTSIGEQAFSGCSSLKGVVIPNSMTIIESRTFYNCSSLATAVIGYSVISIGERAFAGCAALESITSQNLEPPVCDSEVFNGVDKLECFLYVPRGSWDAYDSADQWQDFLYIVEADLETAIHDITINGNDGANGGGEGEIVGYYTTDGKKLSHPQRGINIICYSDGTARKVLVK